MVGIAAPLPGSGRSRRHWRGVVAGGPVDEVAALAGEGGVPAAAVRRCGEARVGPGSRRRTRVEGRAGTGTRAVQPLSSRTTVRVQRVRAGERGREWLQGGCWARLSSAIHSAFNNSSLQSLRYNTIFKFSLAYGITSYCLESYGREY